MARTLTAGPDASMARGVTAPGTTIAIAPWAAFGLVAALLLLLGDRFPTWAYGTLVLALLYLLLTHTDEAAALGGQLVDGLGAALS